MVHGFLFFEEGTVIQCISIFCWDNWVKIAIAHHLLNWHVDMKYNRRIYNVYTCVVCCKPPSATWPFSIFRIFQNVTVCSIWPAWTTRKSNVSATWGLWKSQRKARERCVSWSCEGDGKQVVIMSRLGLRCLIFLLLTRQKSRTGVAIPETSGVSSEAWRVTITPLAGPSSLGSIREISGVVYYLHGFNCSRGHGWWWKFTTRDPPGPHQEPSGKCSSYNWITWNVFFFSGDSARFL